MNRFVYAGHDPTLQVGSDGKSNKYLYLGSKLELRQIDGSNPFVYISDALGSTRRVFKNGDSAQTTFSATCYLPFGKAIVASGSDIVTFAGEMQDSPTGLFYLSARYYDAELGRFYALDSQVGEASRVQTLNRYVYCMDNPLIHVDPSGRFGFLGALFGAIAGAVIGAVVGFVTSGGDMNAAIGGAIGGAAAGALAGFTCGASLFATTSLSLGKELAMNAAQGFIQNFVSTAYTTGGDMSKSLQNGLLGGDNRCRRQIRR